MEFFYNRALNLNRLFIEILDRLLNSFDVTDLVCHGLLNQEPRSGVSLVLPDVPKLVKILKGFLLFIVIDVLLKMEKVSLVYFEFSFFKCVAYLISLNSFFNSSD